MIRSLLALTLLVLLAGCASTGGTAAPALATSGQTLIAAGNSFVSVGAVYTPNCLPAPKTADLRSFCASFKEFAPKFQAAYPLAVATWKAAVSANDVAKARGAEAVVLTLTTDLAAIAAQAFQTLGGR